MIKTSLFNIIDFQQVLDNPRKLKYRMESFQSDIMSEYALSLGYMHGDELFKAIKLCYFDKEITENELRKKLSKDDEISHIIANFPLFKHDNAYKQISWKSNFNELKSEWLEFLKQSIWYSEADDNYFTFKGSNETYRFKNHILRLIQQQGEYRMQKYFRSVEKSLYINLLQDGSSAYKIEDVFFASQAVADICAKGNYLDKSLNIDDDDFFKLSLIKDADYEQKNAIKSGLDNNLLILAGAGSGKTRTLTNRFAYLHLVKKIPLSKIILLTFTRNAAMEIKERGEYLISSIYENHAIKVKANINARTFDSFFYELLLEHWLEIGFTKEPIFYLINDEEVRAKKREILIETIKENNLEDLFARQLEYSQRMDYLIQNMELYAQGLNINWSGIDSLLNFFINKQLSEGIVLGFVYISIMLREALLDDTKGLKEIIISKYQCFLLDEFQDINNLQYTILEKLLAAGIHFSFVGDDDQSIYGWRGSDNAYIQNLSNNPKVKTIYLLTNYRNNPNIVEAGNNVLSVISQRSKTSQKIRPYKNFGSKIRIVEYEKNYINLANEVDRLIQTGISSEQICILTRDVQSKNNVQLALLAARVPIATVAKNIQENDVYYKFLKALLSIWTGVNIIPSARDIKRIAKLEDYTERQIHKIISAQAIEVESRASKLASFSEILLYQIPENLADMVCLISLKSGEIFEGKINEKHSRPVFESFELFCRNSDAPWPILPSHLINLFKAFENNISKEERRGSNLSRGVKLNTIHAVKGLEYDVVFILGLSKGVYPNTRMIDKDYQRRLNELNTLKNARNEYILLKNNNDKNLYDLLIEECKKAIAQDNFYGNISLFKEEVEGSAMDIRAFSAQGIETYLDAYKAFIYPIISKKNHSINKNKQAYKLNAAKLKMMKEEIALLRQAGEDLDDIFAQKAAQVQKLEISLGEEVQELNRARASFEAFKKSIGLIISHHHTCFKARAYLEDMQKELEIDMIREKLLIYKEKMENEEKRTFYVAITRARDILYLAKEVESEASFFINIINDEFKTDFAMFSKQEETEFRKLYNRLKDEISKSKPDDEILDKICDELMQFNKTRAELVEKKTQSYLKENHDFKDLPGMAKRYFLKALNLLYISEITAYDFRLEAIYYLQKMSEKRLLSSAGKDALLFTIQDENEAREIAENIREFLISHNISAPSREYLFNIFYKKNCEHKNLSSLNNLKALSIMYFAVLSEKYPVPSKIKKTWKGKGLKNNASEFMEAVISLANARNVLSQQIKEEQELKLWPEDLLPKIFKYCRNILAYT